MRQPLLSDVSVCLCSRAVAATWHIFPKANPVRKSFGAQSLTSEDKFWLRSENKAQLVAVTEWKRKKSRFEKKIEFKWTLIGMDEEQIQELERLQNERRNLKDRIMVVKLDLSKDKHFFDFFLFATKETAFISYDSFALMWNMSSEKRVEFEVETIFVFEWKALFNFCCEKIQFWKWNNDSVEKRVRGKMHSYFRNDFEFFCWQSMCLIISIVQHFFFALGIEREKASFLQSMLKREQEMAQHLAQRENLFTEVPKTLKESDKM